MRSLTSLSLDPALEVGHSLDELLHRSDEGEHGLVSGGRLRGQHSIRGLSDLPVSHACILASGQEATRGP